METTERGHQMSKEHLKTILYEIRVRTEGVSHGYKDTLTTKEQGQLHQHMNELDKMVRRLKE